MEHDTTTSTDAVSSPMPGLSTIDMDRLADAPQMRRGKQKTHQFTGVANGERGSRAVVYLRVSSKKQVDTDYDPEGISLPAQRLACHKKIEQMGLQVVGEYIDAGFSGTDVAGREHFQDMLERIRVDQDVDYVIVYKLSRLHRNRYDEAFTMMQLQQRGVTLVSATESIDGSPVGQLMQGILSAFNQYRSAEDGADIAYKLGEKAKKGGTVFRAPLGYINTGERVADREVRVVKPDPDRAELVRLAFELYATGSYSIPALADELHLRGLSTRASARWPSKQLSDNQLLRLLQDPYYLGFTRFKGDIYPGRHEPLVDGDLFGRVQDVVARRARGERQRVHHHYLKSTLYCGHCYSTEKTHGRVIIARVNGRGGTYDYFFCRRSQEKLCDAPYMQMPRIEDAVERYWARLRVSPGFIEAARAGLRMTVESDQATARSLHKQLSENLQKLAEQEEKLVDLAADGMLPREVVQKRMNGILRNRAAMSARLEKTEQKLAAVVDYLDAALSLLIRPGELYANSTDEQRRMLNQAVFSRIYVHADEVTEVEFNEPFDMLMAAGELFENPTKTAPGGRGGDVSSEAATLVNIARGDFSSNDDVVGTVGPASKKSGGLLPPLEKLQKLAELAAVVPTDFADDPDETDRSWLVRRRLTDEQVAELVELYRSGVGTPALSQRFGISKPSVLELLHDRGVQMRRQPLTKTQRARAVQLYEEGLAIKPIAAELGSSFGAVHRVLKAESVRLRPRPGR